MATIETGRLSLRPPGEGDVPALVQALGEDPDIAWFIPLIPTRTPRPTRVNGWRLMTEGVIAVVRWAASEHGLHDLHLTAQPDNLAGRPLARRDVRRLVGNYCPPVASRLVGAPDRRSVPGWPIDFKLDRAFRVGHGSSLPVARCRS